MPARMSLSDRDVRTMLRVIHPDEGADGEPIPWSVLDGIRQLIACEGIYFFRLDTVTKSVPVYQDLPAEDVGDVEAADLDQAFWTHYWSSCCSYPDRSGDLTSVTTDSDFHSQRQLHSTAMYADYQRFFGIERELLMCLPSPRYQTLRLMLTRGRGPDFSDRDRALLTLLRPHLHATYLAGVRRSVPSLTARQTELLRWVAAGRTNRQIAHRLGVAESTVRKHLENIFGRLQVTSRAAAVTKVFGRDPLD
jgi:DNA-binding CsgD family transcriptional regulator